MLKATVECPPFEIAPDAAIVKVAETVIDPANILAEIALDFCGG